MRVFNVFEERVKEEEVVTSLEELKNSYGLEDVAAVSPGDELLHLVRNQANLAYKPGCSFRAALHTCVVVALTVNRAKVRFPNGTTKAVKYDSLFRRKT